MRKLLLSIVILLSLSACNKEPADMNVSTSVPKVEQQRVSSEEQIKQKLIVASENNDLERVKALLREAERYVNDHEDTTTLIWAVKEGHMQVVKSLLAVGKDVNETFDGDDTGSTALMCAVTNGHIDMVKLLLSAGANVNKPSAYTGPALADAARAGYTEIVKLLLEAGADVNLADEVNGQTALMQAAERGSAESVELLLKAGADVNAKDKDGNTALTLAQEAGNEKIVQLLKQAGAKEGSHVKKEASALKYRIDVELKEPPIDFSSYKGTLPLDEEGNPILWSVLIKEENKNKAREYQKRIGAGKKITPQELHDALLGACRHKNQYAVSVLLDAGANMSEEEWSKVIREKVMYTDNPVEESPEDINETLVLLLAAGAEADGSSLVEASQCGFSKAVKTLLATGNIEKEYISKALFEAIEENVYWPENQTEIVQTLLEAGADPNVTDEHGYSALKAAENNSKIVQLLKQAGAKEQTI